MNPAEQIWQDIQTIVNKNTDSFRVSMNSNTHCMDVGIAALKASDPSIDYATKEKLHRVFRKSFNTVTSLEEAILFSKDVENIDRTLFVEDRVFGDYLVGPSYPALQRRVSAVLKSSLLQTSFTGTDAEGKTIVNIGHLSLEESSAATTPLEVKLRSLLGSLAGTPIAKDFIASKISQLHKYHNVNTSYAFNRKSFNLERFKEILGSGTVLVTLQTTIKNASLAKLEGRIEAEVRAYLTNPKFHDKLLRSEGSNTILEDIAGAVMSILSGKADIPGSKHSAKPPKKTTASLLNKKSTAVSRLPQLRTRQGRFTSLASLQTLLNLALAQQIQRNMGTGTSKNILNYRTGRFAESAEVTSMSQSREGMITAFYTYMKYPYQTFQPGYAQGAPASRDPKLLISKSIREILSTQVKNRLRAVLA